MFTSVKKYFYSDSDKNLNIRIIFKPLYVVLCLFGLFPFTLKFHKDKCGFRIIKKSIYFNAVCAVSFVLFMFSFLGIHIRYVYKSIDDTTLTREVMTQMNYVLELFVGTLFCLIAYVSTYRNRFMYVKIINQIANLIEPANIGVTNAVKKFKSQMRVIMIFLLTVTILQVLVNMTRNSSNWKIFLVVATFNLPLTIQFTWLAFFYVLILMLVVLLKSIREHIISIIHDRTNVLDCYTRSDTKVFTLQNAESMYTTAGKLKREINKAFQASLLITTLQCFHSTVSEAHIIYHIVVIERDFTLHPIFNCAIWIIYQVIKVFIMTRSGNLLKRQYLKIGQELHNIPIQKYESRLMLEIQHFSTLMTFQDDDLSVYGLFSLDATLLSKILASSVMYVVILVQFDKS